MQRIGFIALLVVFVLGLPIDCARAMPEQASANRTSKEMAGLPDKPAAKPPKSFGWVDTRSPRGVLESLLTGTRRYYDLIREEGFTRQNWRELSNISEQAERLFDLRGVPPGHIHDIAHETTVLLREALARVSLPKLDKVPEEEVMAARIKAGKSPIYRVRGTPFEIARTDTGPDATSSRAIPSSMPGIFMRRSRIIPISRDRLTSKVITRLTFHLQDR